MANTKKLAPILYGKRQVILYLTLVSDGTQETDYVVYDSSAVHTILGDTDQLNCQINSVSFTTNSAAGLVRLEWDATADVTALTLPLASGGSFRENYAKNFVPLPNQGGAGITGDITLTTTGLASGDTFTLILDVRPYG